MPLEKRTCTKCGEEKLLGLFPRNAPSTGGYRKRCRDCAYKVESHRRALKKRAQKLNNQFGSTPELP